jgi:hypothetical protein
MVKLCGLAGAKNFVDEGMAGDLLELGIS